MLGWVLNVVKLIPHLDAAKEVHRASGNPSQLISYYSH